MSSSNKKILIAGNGSTGLPKLPRPLNIDVEKPKTVETINDLIAESEYVRAVLINQYKSQEQRTKEKFDKIKRQFGLSHGKGKSKKRKKK